MLTEAQAQRIVELSQAQVIRGNFHTITVPGGASMVPRNLDEIIGQVTGELVPQAVPATEDETLFPPAADTDDICF